MRRVAVLAFALLCLALSAAAAAAAARAPRRGELPMDASAVCESVAFRYTTRDRDAHAAATHAALMERADPASALYRKHMSIAEYAAAFGAPDLQLNGLLDVLIRDFGIAPHTVDVGVTKDTVVVKPIERGSALFEALRLNGHCQRRRASVQHFDAPEPFASLGFGSAAARCAGSTGADRKRRRARAAKAGSQFPGMEQTPPTIRVRYGIPDAEVVAAANHTMAVAEFEGEQFYQSDVTVFAARYANKTTLPPVRVVGPNNGGYFGEGTLDLEYLMGLAQGVETYWVEETYFDLVAWSKRLLSITPMPTLASVSWGSGESGFSAQSVASDNEEFKKLGLLGISVLAASGDQGTGSTGIFSCGTFDPNWPASSPYVTAVGATYSNTAAGSEISWSGSGGGFSTMVARPTWQETQVAAYLGNASVTLPPKQYWNSTGRATPDVSALGCNFNVYSSVWGLETGTSAATPTFGAIIARINGERLAAGKSTLGFLNPTLYKLGRVGFDVTSGDNKNPSCPAGFVTAPGWDPVSGLGTPSYEYLRQAL